MQEEIENRSINLAVTVTRTSLPKALRLVLKLLRAGKHMVFGKKTAHYKNGTMKQGKMKVKELMRSHDKMENIDVAKTDIKGFERYCKKYSVDFAVVKEKGTDPPRYTLFFKAKDAASIEKALSEYTAAKKRNLQKPSVLAALSKFKEIIKGLGQDKDRNRRRERER